MKNEIESKKCEVLQKAAYSRDIRPEFQCVVSSDCAHNVASQQSDVAILPRYDPAVKENKLQPILLESYEDHYIVVAKKGIIDELLRKTAL